MISELHRQQKIALSAISYRTHDRETLRRKAVAGHHSPSKLAAIKQQIEADERGQDTFVALLASTDIAQLKLSTSIAPLDLLSEIARAGLLPIHELLHRAKCETIPHEYLALAIAGRLAAERAERLSDASNGEDPEIDLLFDFECAVFDRLMAAYRG